MNQKKIRFGIIGLGLMGKEFASAVARWCTIAQEELPVPEITGICARSTNKYAWFQHHFPSISIATPDYTELLASDKIDAIYCAVPHDLHEPFYSQIIKSKKHLLGEKPFGIDKLANKNILDVVRMYPGQLIRCSSEFPYFPGAQFVIDWILQKKYGRIMEVRVGFHHASDLDPNKPINWKRMVEINGEYGCMGDLGMHVLHIPLRMGWMPKTVYAELQNLMEKRPDGNGTMVPCNTWDNASLLCTCTDPDTYKPFVMQIETKRMMPGATNNWYIEIYGTEGSIRFSTQNPRSVYYSWNDGKQQPWARLDLGMNTLFPTVTGGIFEPGFSDVFQQMLAAYLAEFSTITDGSAPKTNISGSSKRVNPNGILGCVTPEETYLSHVLFTAALKSYYDGKRVSI